MILGFYFGFFFYFYRKNLIEYKYFIIFMVLNSDFKINIDNIYILRWVIYKIGGF